MQSGICFQSLSNLVELDLSFNKISNLGGNLNAKLGNVRKLNLAGNELDSVEGNLRTSFLLICLFCLKAEQVPSLYALQPSPCVVWEKVRLLLIFLSRAMVIVAIVILTYLWSFLGLHKLYSLTVLNLSDNNFSNVGAMLSLGQLPCLESLDFRKNEMTKDPLYRLRVFTAFDDRAEEVCNRTS